MDLQLADEDRETLRDPPLAELVQGHRHVAAGEVDDGPVALHLVDGGQPIGVVLAGGLGDQPLEHRRVPGDALEGPAQRGGGGLVSGGQQGQQFIADLAAGHRRTVVVGAAQE